MIYSKKANHKSLLVIAVFIGNCLKQFHFQNLGPEISKKYEKFRCFLTSSIDNLCTVSRIGNVIISCNLSNKQNTMTVS